MKLVNVDDIGSNSGQEISASKIEHDARRLRRRNDCSTDLASCKVLVMHAFSGAHTAAISSTGEEEHEIYLRLHEIQEAVPDYPVHSMLSVTTSTKEAERILNADQSQSLCE